MPNCINNLTYLNLASPRYTLRITSFSRCERLSNTSNCRLNSSKIISFTQTSQEYFARQRLNHDFQPDLNSFSIAANLPRCPFSFSFSRLSYCWNQTSNIFPSNFTWSGISPSFSLCLIALILFSAITITVL